MKRTKSDQLCQHVGRTTLIPISTEDRGIVGWWVNESQLCPYTTLTRGSSKRGLHCQFIAHSEGSLTVGGDALTKRMVSKYR